MEKNTINLLQEVDFFDMERFWHLVWAILTSCKFSLFLFLKHQKQEPRVSNIILTIGIILGSRYWHNCGRIHQPICVDNGLSAMLTILTNLGVRIGLLICRTIDTCGVLFLFFICLRSYLHHLMSFSSL
jgi:hypothetical protein